MTQGDDESRHESLSRYIDGDLPGEEAIRIASLLTTDANLRQETEALRAVLSSVRSAGPHLGSQDAETSRLRTLARLRATVETEQWQNETQIVSKKARPPFVALFANWQPAVMTLVTAATVVGVYLLLPQPRTELSNPPIVPLTNPGSAATLPNEDEMGLLLDLHDAHGGAYTGEEAMVHRSRIAEAQASLLKRADDAVAQHL